MSSVSQKVISQPAQFFRSGLGLKKHVADQLNSDYASEIIDHFKKNEYCLRMGDLTIYLAKEFGFCYGVDRAVDYAYQTKMKFPDRRIFLTGEIIHNPHVNQKMIDMGIEFLTGQYAGGNSYDSLAANDVVLLPAFGVSVQEMQFLTERGCILVDTTCGSVLNVWKRVEQYARDGFTSVIHGKYWHEETRATSSQTMKYPHSHYLVVLDMAEAEQVCDYIAGKWNREAFLRQFEKAISPGFDPDLHLQYIGVANQTTMLSSESLAIAERIGSALADKYGEQEVSEHFRTFDTICSATQERQDAILDLVQNKELDIMLIIGGYNSSNTTHLAEIAGKYTTAYHIDDANCLEGVERLRHKPLHEKSEHIVESWLPNKAVKIGLTAGASTPNNKIGEVVARLAKIRRLSLREYIPEQ